MRAFLKMMFEKLFSVETWTMGHTSFSESHSVNLDLIRKGGACFKMTVGP